LGDRRLVLRCGWEWGGAHCVSGCGWVRGSGVEVFAGRFALRRRMEYRAADDVYVHEEDADREHLYGSEPVGARAWGGRVAEKDVEDEGGEEDDEDDLDVSVAAATGPLVSAKLPAVAGGGSSNGPARRRSVGQARAAGGGAGRSHAMGAKIAAGPAPEEEGKLPKDAPALPVVDAFLTGTEKGMRTTWFVVYVDRDPTAAREASRPVRVAVRRRFTDFSTLLEELQIVKEAKKLPPMPKGGIRNIFKSKDDSTVREREFAFTRMLQIIVENAPLRSSESFRVWCDPRYPDI